MVVALWFLMGVLSLPANGQERPRTLNASIGIGEQYGALGIAGRYRFDSLIELGGGIGVLGHYAVVVRRGWGAAYLQLQYAPQFYTDPNGLQEPDEIRNGLTLVVGRQQRPNGWDVHAGFAIATGPGQRELAPGWSLGWGGEFGPPIRRPKSVDEERARLDKCGENPWGWRCHSETISWMAYRRCKEGPTLDIQVLACRLLMENFPQVPVDPTGAREVRRRQENVAKVGSHLPKMAGHVPWEEQVKSARCVEMTIRNRTGGEIARCVTLVDNHKAWFRKLSTEVPTVRQWGRQVEKLAVGAPKDAPIAPFASRILEFGCSDMEPEKIAAGKVSVNTLNACKAERRRYESWSRPLMTNLGTLNSGLPLSEGHTRFRPEMESAGCVGMTEKSVAAGQATEEKIVACQELIDQHLGWRNSIADRLIQVKTSQAQSIGHTRYRPKFKAKGCTTLTFLDIVTGALNERTLGECEKIAGQHRTWWSALKSDAEMLALAIVEAQDEAAWSNKFAKHRCAEMTAIGVATGAASVKTFGKCKKLGAKFTGIYGAKIKRQALAGERQRRASKRQRRAKDRKCCNKIFHQNGMRNWLSGLNHAKIICGPDACWDLEDCLQECNYNSNSSSVTDGPMRACALTCTRSE
jgi:hypothetical protein